MKSKNNTPAQIRLIRNEDDSSHLIAIKQIFADAREIAVCMAYLKMSGLTLLDGILDEIIRSGTQMTMLVGTDQYLTEPQALKVLLRKIEHSGNGEAFLVQRSGITYHPKIYFARKKDSAIAVIGSANITGGGLRTNIEASIHAIVDLNSRFCRQIDSYIASLKRDPETVPLGLISISQYEARYEIFKNHRQKAERTAKEEINNLLEIDEKRLRRYLKEYLADSNEARNRKLKARDYVEARTVLDSIADLRRPTKVEFMELYELLVGSHGGRKLWHSGSIFRSKNKVVLERNQAVMLVQTLKHLIGKPPETIYTAALKQSRKIQGIGPNVISEILNTYAPKQYAVLNKNPIESLRALGFTRFPAPASFTAGTYAAYCEFMISLGKTCRLKDLSDLDHFMNFIYWKYAKK